MNKLAGIGARGGAIAAGVALAAIALLGYLAVRPSSAPETPPLATLEPAPVAPEVTAVIVTETSPVSRSEPAPVVVTEAPPAVATEPGPPDTPVAALAETVSPDVLSPPSGVTAPPTETRPPAPVAPLPAAPSFDVVRVEPDGSALIAGRAPARAVVSVLLDGVVIAAETADGRGGFVVLVTIDPASAPRVLSLSAVLPDGGLVLLSQQTVILAPSAEDLLASAAPLADGVPVVPASDEAARVGLAPGLAATPAAPAGIPAVSALPVAAGAAPAVVSDTTPDLGAADPVTGAAPGAPDQPNLPSRAAAVPGATVTAANPMAPAVVPPANLSLPGLAGEAAAPIQVAPAQAPRILVADDRGVRVMQDPGAGPVAMTNVSIDTITYDAAGEVVLGGRGNADGYVRVYIDNDPIRTTRIDADGQWRTNLPRIDTKVYTLRVDEVSESGEVISRTETPFQPEAPEAVNAAGDADGPPVALVTVQPGFTLWRIARENYGEGLLYVRVFEANADKIRDPDLIYPGQIFTVPQ